MYLALCIMSCFAAFVLVWAVGAAIASAGGSLWRRRTRAGRSETAARLLFGLRMFPPALALLLTVGLVLPAFLKLEPQATAERIHPGFALLAAAGSLLALAMLWRIVER